MYLLFNEKLPKFLFPLNLFLLAYVYESRILSWLICDHWTTKLESVIWDSLIGLYPLIMKSFGNPENNSFDERSVYPKPVAFLPVLFIEVRGFLNLFYFSENMFCSCFSCQLQILRPMLCSVYLELFRSPMVCCILYFVSICPLPLDCLHPFLPVVITVKVASIWSCL